MLERIIDQIKGKHDLVGIDIGSSSIKLLELKNTNGHYSVAHYAMGPQQSGTMLERDIKNPQALSEAIREVVRASGTNAKYAAIAVPDSAVISKVIQMDASLTDAEMSEHIMVEADKHIPYPIEEVSLDFQIIGASTKNPDCVDVLLVASHREYVDSYVSAVSDSGLIVKVVDVQSYVIERIYDYLVQNTPGADIQQTVAVIDIGASMLTLTVLHDGNAIFTRSEAFGGLQLTQSIQQRFNLSFAEAEDAKHNGSLPPEYVTEILDPFKELVVLQIRRALQFFFSNSQQAEVQQLFLAGGTALIPGLVEQVGERLAINSALANPLRKLINVNNPKDNMLNQLAPSFAIAFGLALRRFDEHHGII